MSAAHFLVTGTASGVGAALASQLRAAGDRLTGCDRQAGDNILACDLTDMAAISQLVDGLDAPLDGLACVAGVPGTLAPETVLRVNYWGTRALIDRSIPKLRDGGAIVVVSSLAAQKCTFNQSELDDLFAISNWDGFLAHEKIAGIDGGRAYEISKRLIMAYATGLVSKLAARSIRVNTVMPGPVETPLLSDFRKSMGVERIEAARSLVGRHAQAVEIAHPIAFLLSRQASWVNGLELPLDGGLGAIRARPHSVNS